MLSRRCTAAGALATPRDSLPDADRISVSVSSPLVDDGARGGKMSQAVAGDGTSAGAREPGRPQRDHNPCCRTFASAEGDICALPDLKSTRWRWRSHILNRRLRRGLIGFLLLGPGVTAV